MRPPSIRPIGLELTRAAKAVNRAFDDALVEAGGTLPMWLVLVSLEGGPPGTQRDLAATVGVEGPTLTHHLNRMEDAGLVVRTRDPHNRRIQHVELTDAGEAMFQRLRRTVTAFDARLRRGVTASEVEFLGGLLKRLQANVASEEPS